MIEEYHNVTIQNNRYIKRKYSVRYFVDLK